MTLTSLKAVTWSTVTGAVVGALLLASTEAHLLPWSSMRRAETPSRIPSTDSQRTTPTSATHGVMTITETQRPIKPR